MIGKLDGYHLAAGIEDSGGFGVQIFIRRPPEVMEHLEALDDTSPGGALSPKEKAEGLLNREADRLHQKLRVQAVEIDPKTAVKQVQTKAQLQNAFAVAGLDPIFMEPVPNEYWPEGHEMVVGQPWYIVTTCIGHIKVGWRKRVIVLDWSRSTIRIPSGVAYGPEPRIPTAHDLFPAEDVTRSGSEIHCWSYGKLTQYLKVLLSHRPMGMGEMWLDENGMWAEQER